MREDFHTSTPEDAAQWQRDHAPDYDRDRDYDEDNLTAGDVESCGHCGGEFCYSCAFSRVFGGW